MNIKNFKFIEMNRLYTTYIPETVQKSINNIMDKKYKILHQKLNKLEREQTPPPPVILPPLGSKSYKY